VKRDKAMLTIYTTAPAAYDYSTTVDQGIIARYVPGVSNGKNTPIRRVLCRPAQVDRYHSAMVYMVDSTEQFAAKLHHGLVELV
jgi:hypothetical protein